MAKVLRVREIQSDAARAGVTVARMAEQRAEDALAQSRDHYAALAVDTSSQPAAAFLGLRERASHRATAVGLADGNRRVAAEATADAVAAWHVANRRVEALERLDGRRREEYGVELRRFEDAAVDELVVARARSSA
jgi:hypothetical protein